MFEQAFKNMDDILWKDDGVDAQQQDMYRKYSSRVMQEQLPNVIENNWKSMVL